MRRSCKRVCVFLLLLPATLVMAQREPDNVPAVQPEVQTAEWAKSWWGKRHEEKLMRADKRRIRPMIQKKPQQRTYRR